MLFHHKMYMAYKLTIAIFHVWFLNFFLIIAMVHCFKATYKL